MTIDVRHGDAAWRSLMMSILQQGESVAPRGQPTREVLHTNMLRVRMCNPLVTSPMRRLNYRFAAAEALWILSGDNRLAPLQRFIKTYDRFSDDGVTLTGAYGPPVNAQLGYVLNALLADRDTRQAVLTIWRPSPAPSKDIPCTIGMVFAIRDGLLHQHVFMRSSDAWLGIPYDMLSFACIGIKIACLFNRAVPDNDAIEPGTLTISATSSHLYEKDIPSALAVLASEPAPIGNSVPRDLVLAGDWAGIEDSLVAVREDAPAEHWMWQLPRRGQV